MINVISKKFISMSEFKIFPFIYSNILISWKAKIHLTAGLATGIYN